MRTRLKDMITTRRVVVLAKREARRLRHRYVNTEHLLLGLLADREGVAAVVLESLGISLEEAREWAENIGSPWRWHGGRIRLTPRARDVLERSLQEALQLGHAYVGTEHLLLSMLAEDDRIPASQVLPRRGASYALVRERVVALLTARHEPDPQTRLVRLPVPAGLADITGQLRQVRQQKTAAAENGDLDSVTALRGREQQLRAVQLQLEQEWAAGVDVRAVIAENQRVHSELDRLRGLLRQHGIEPDGGTAPARYRARWQLHLRRQHLTRG